MSTKQHKKSEKSRLKAIFQKPQNIQRYILNSYNLVEKLRYISIGAHVLVITVGTGSGMVKLAFRGCQLTAGLIMANFKFIGKRK